VERDWYAWHSEYDEPGSRLARRLDLVRERVAIALDEALGDPSRVRADGVSPVRVLSLVAGQGRDLIPLLATHPRRADIAARLVELDPRNVEVAATLARAADLTEVVVVTADAAQLDLYADLEPTDVLLLCGLFGNISDADIENTISWVPALLRRGGTVIWTRYRGEPDRVEWINEAFRRHGLAPVWLSDPSLSFGVGVNRSERDPVPILPGVTLFAFVGHERRPDPSG
jgi:SAM-dependent methyltransferase